MLNWSTYNEYIAWVNEEALKGDRVALKDNRGAVKGKPEVIKRWILRIRNVSETPSWHP